jgi:hypothetical protein
VKSQNERILAHLRIAPINQLQALKYAGCMRLGARIWDLREAGHRIDDRMKKVTNRRGEICHVKEYWLLPEAK